MVLPLAAAGCASTPEGPGDLSTALTDYRGQRYEQARHRAAAAGEAGDAETRERARYLEGLCAYQLADYETARLLLSETAAGSAVPSESQATLGLVYLELSRPSDAADAFAAAAVGLSGDDGRRSMYYAARSFAAAGDAGAAAAWTQRLADPTHPGWTGAADGRFTIQVGAFRERARAERAAVDAAEAAEGHGLGPVRIVPRTDTRGEVLYVVQVGAFGSRTAAQSARRRMGNLQYIVATRDPGDMLQ